MHEKCSTNDEFFLEPHHVSLAWGGQKLIRALRSSWRRVFVPHRNVTDVLIGGERIIVAFFHGRQLGLFAYPHPTPMVQMASLSRDGALQASILEGLGFHVVRGSSSRGGAQALDAMTQCLREGYHAALAVDGPRGPKGEPKRGAVELSRRTGAWIVPLGGWSSPGILLEKSWDRYRVVPPFARVALVEGAPFQVPSDTRQEDLASYLERLRNDIEQADLQAKRLLEPSASPHNS